MYSDTSTTFYFVILIIYCECKFCKSVLCKSSYFFYKKEEVMGSTAPLVNQNNRPDK